MSSLGLGEMQDVSTAHTWLMITSNGASISLYNEMVAFRAHRMCTPAYSLAYNFKQFKSTIKQNTLLGVLEE